MLLWYSLAHTRSDIQVRRLIPISFRRLSITQTRRKLRVIFPGQDIYFSNQRPMYIAQSAFRRGDILLKTRLHARSLGSLAKHGSDETSVLLLLRVIRHISDGIRVLKSLVIVHPFSSYEFIHDCVGIISRLSICETSQVTTISIIHFID